MLRAATSAALVAGIALALGCEGQPVRALAPVLWCGESIASYCTGAHAKACNWSLYADPTQFSCASTSLAACGSYDVAASSGLDVGEASYYDAATGRLVAVIGYSANGGGGHSCVAGPAGGFAAPECPSSDFTGSCPGGHACSPDGADCMTDADCCSASCAPQGAARVCCPASGCP